MKKRVLAMLISAVLSVGMLCACGGSEAAPETTKTEEKKEEKKEETKTETKDEGGITFADLQENYKTLKETYDSVEELYMNDAIQGDENITELLSQCKEVIDEMGELTEADFGNQQDMVDMNNTMVSLLGSLGQIVDAMQVAEPAEPESDPEETDMQYVDGYYANDGTTEFIITFFSGSDGDFAYVYDGEAEAFAEYTVESVSSTSSDFEDYLLVTVGALELGYYIDDDGDVWITDGETLYAAAQLSESEADEIMESMME
ncbi:MAG: hypothetical protein IK115_10850 [Lachnospiraceae bacterium]|nr:hypothetical protein [Lachnospiraceae bacterium]